MQTEEINRHIDQVARELGIPVKSVKAAAELLLDGATIPFIARYRKERTGSLDETQLEAIRDRMNSLAELDKRREAILASIEKQGKLTPDLIGLIVSATSLAELEDIYLPFRPKRKTRASEAREKGLEPLAKALFEQGSIDPEQVATSYIDHTKGVSDVATALQGARDIIAEWISEDVRTRKSIRNLFRTDGTIHTRLIRGKEQDGQKFKDYFDWHEAVAKIPSHRLLAIRRGEKEGIISVQIAPEEDKALGILNELFLKSSGPAAAQVRMAAEDGYKRLLQPSLETEIRVESKMKADEDAIRVFATNLRELLLAAPLGQKSVLAIDPGFRSGCKVVCLDPQGKLVFDDVIFPLEPKKDRVRSAERLKKLCEEHRVEAIAIGNGTAGRETEAFVRSAGLSQRITIIMVNESGASVYSASEIARTEFPDKDITVRGAVSIGRRLMDPLSELVKVDPKSIGVGQYQHDVEQQRLKEALDDVVSSCVNAVGVEVNTASRELLTYVSGIGPVLARTIVDYRNANGPFRRREDLMQVNRFGEKVFEQSAGFLRIRDGENPLDASAVHPESYAVVERMAKDLGCTVNNLMTSREIREQLDLSKYVTETVGLPTLQDILGELEKPGRDPRATFDPVVFAEGIHKPEDLTVGMKVPGIVTNVTNFGAFVDIGVHQDGLVHISHLSDDFVKDPNTVVTVGQHVRVTVTEVDLGRERISLSMKTNPMETPPAREKKPLRQERNNDRRKPAGEKQAKRPEKQSGSEISLEDKLAQLMNKYKKR